MSTPLKILLAFAVAASVVMVVLIGVLMYLVMQSPDTFAYTGQQMKKAHLDTIRELGLLNDGEQVQYFYSDAFFDIRKGMYFITDERLVLYSDDWVEPLHAVPYDQIVDVEGVFDDSFFVDTIITVTLQDDEQLSFPVSSERGHDKDFFEYIDARCARRAAPVEPLP